MRFVVLGAAGFVGRHIVAELLASGHHVTVAGRSTVLLARNFPDCTAIGIDLERPLPADLVDRLRGAEILVNAAGLLDGPALAAVHVDGPRALYAAAREAGIGRIVLISAISARAGVDTAYATTKRLGEAVLRESGVPWTILKPSLIVAKGSFGGTSALRGLAGFPFVLPLLGAASADFSPIHARDLGRTIDAVAQSPAFAGATLEPAGPDRLTLAELARRYRRWLGIAPGIEVPIPLFAVRALCWVGDWIGGGPLSTAALGQLLVGNAGDGAAFARAIGFAPPPLDTLLAREPADVQDRWQARLFFPRLSIRVALAVIWLVSGLVGLITGPAMADSVLGAVGLSAGSGLVFAVGTSLLDLGIAAAFLLPAARRHLPLIQTVVVLGYTLGLTLLLPGLWLDPFGALTKNIAVLGLIAVDALLRETR